MEKGNNINSFTDIKNAFYINLEHRTDRKEHVLNQLTNLGLPNVERFNAIKMENGAIGCSMSHLKILKNAYENMEFYCSPNLFHHWWNCWIFCCIKID